MSSEGQKDLHELSASILKKNNDATLLRKDAASIKVMSGFLL